MSPNRGKKNKVHQADAVRAAKNNAIKRGGLEDQEKPFFPAGRKKSFWQPAAGGERGPGDRKSTKRESRTQIGGKGVS